jgi:peptidoglycan hydrolase-like protein with peptidoglycan-binding domain
LASFLAFGAVAAAPPSATTPNEDAVMRQQEALIWTVEYEGLIDGKAGPETIRAIKKFQLRVGNPETGMLTQAEIDRLLKEGGAAKRLAGFKEITDKTAGVFVGLPLGLFSSATPTPTKWGQHWYGRQAGLAIDTLRFGSEVSLRDLYDRLLRINNRTIMYQRLVNDQWFAISALEGNAAVYVRADVVRLPEQRTEIRGFSIWMSKDRPDLYQALAPAMTSSFRATDTIGGELSRSLPQPNQPLLKPNLPPIPTNSGPPANLDECFRGLGPASCPSVLAARP